MVPGLISIMPILTVESFAPESFLILVETPQCSQEYLCLPGLNSGIFQMWGKWDNHCTAEATAHTHKEKKTKTNTGARWEREISVTTATAKICFSLRQPWGKEAQSSRKLQRYSSKGLCLLSWTQNYGGFHTAACSMSVIPLAGISTRKRLGTTANSFAFSLYRRREKSEELQERKIKQSHSLKF